MDRGIITGVVVRRRGVVPTVWELYIGVLSSVDNPHSLYFSPFRSSSSDVDSTWNSLPRSKRYLSTVSLPTLCPRVVPEWSVLVLSLVRTKFD